MVQSIIMVRLFNLDKNNIEKVKDFSYISVDDAKILQEKLKAIKKHKNTIVYQSIKSKKTTKTTKKIYFSTKTVKNHFML